MRSAGTLATMQRLSLFIGLIMVISACSGDGGSVSTLPAASATATVSTPIPDASGQETTAAPTVVASPLVETTTTAMGSTTPLPDLRLIEVASGLRQPVFVTAPPGDDRLFIVDQPGSIDVWRDGTRLGAFLDIRGLVEFGGEQGLLGVAFHPDYPADPRFYLHYTTRGSGANVLAEYRVSEDPNAADPESGRILLQIPQPAGNHNGGMIAFGPDGFLYAALGDGGGAGDQFGNGQNRDTLLGAIIRIDVDGDPYRIPASNPFADGGGAPEIWAWGLRNPWRFSFDGSLVVIGDVGQGTSEEIDVVDYRDSGPNFGWPVLEGTECFAATGCDPSPFRAPVHEYRHEAGACSVIGGYVYRGSAVAELSGAYFFGDFCSGAITSFFIEGEGIRGLVEWPELTSSGLTSFGVDGAGELYVTVSSGSVFRIGPA